MTDSSLTTTHTTVPVKVYIAVFLALLALTALTTAVAFHNFGPYNTPIALIIAGLKASLVATFFMHLRYSPKIFTFVALASLLWLGIMVTIFLTDYLTRGGGIGWS